MAKIGPRKFVVKCYGERKGDKWIGVCLNLNLATEADSPENLVKKMNGIIKSYLETVFDTEDKNSIPALLYRSAPLGDWCKYYFIRICFFVENFHKFIIFKEETTVIPCLA